MNAVIIPAAGYGQRMKSPINKQFLKLKGIPVVLRTTRVFVDLPEIDQIILVFREDELAAARQGIVQAFPEANLCLVPGGATRQDSVANALEVLDPATEIVLIHDGARPLVEPDLVRRVLQKTKESGAAIAAVPVKDTIKIVKNQRIVQTPDRESLWAAQTPQGFKKEIILEAHGARRGLSTDDAALVESLGYPVSVVLGSYRNIKMTTPEDLLLAEAFLEEEES